MLLVEQNAEMALGLADRVYIIDHGSKFRDKSAGRGPLTASGCRTKLPPRVRSFAVGLAGGLSMQCPPWERLRRKA
jgi:hypothetical protein